MSENNTISPGLKNTFLAHIVAALVTGIPFLVFPEDYADLLDFTIEEPMVYRMVGAAILAFGASSWFAYRATNWNDVKIIVITEIIWTFLATIVTVWGVLSDDFPAFAWLDAIVMAAFFVAFGWFYYQTLKE
jgi:hypothetical protein